MNIQQQKQYRVLLIGDSCIDEYYYGTCKRINQEAPTQLLDIHSFKKLEGMSANVKQNLIGLGIEVEHITNKELIKKTRFVDSFHNIQVLRADTQPKIAPIDVESFKKKYHKNELSKYSSVVFSDYNKGFINESEIRQIIDHISKNSNLLIFVDSKKTNVACFRNCFLKINEHEFEKIKSVPENSKLIVTLGENGAKFDNKIFPSYELNINDVTRIGDRCGAGDTFFAGLICRYLETQDIIESIKFANICASFSVRKIGVYQIKRGDLENLCI